MPNWFQQILASGQNQGSRSNVIKPLLYILGVISGALILLINIKAPNYIIIILVIMLVAIFIAVLVAYFMCLNKNPDLLRSENYNIEQSIIQKTSFIGDSNNPLFDKMRNRGMIGKGNANENKGKDEGTIILDESNQGGE